jgi:alpha-tubulin suppressor-like RCC1 family protein
MTSPRIPPVRLCCGKRHTGVICPDGKVMCQICWHRFDQDGMYVDNQGDRWDVCEKCGREDADR